MDRRKISSALSPVIRFFLTANALLWIGFWFVNTTAPKNMGIEKYNPLMEILYNVPIIFIFPVVFVFLRLILFSKKPSEHYRPVCHNWFFLGLIMTIFAVLSYVMTFNGGALISSFWRGILAGSPLTLVLFAGYQGFLLLLGAYYDMALNREDSLVIKLYNRVKSRLPARTRSSMRQFYYSTQIELWTEHEIHHRPVRLVIAGAIVAAICVFYILYGMPLLDQYVLSKILS